MGHYRQLRFHCDLSTKSKTAWVRSTPHVIRIVLLLLFLLIPLEHAFGQGDFESYLADAVKAQSANDIRGAISAYQKALSLRPDVPEIWANLGLMQHLAGDQPAALKSFTKANQLQPKLFVPLLF